MPQQHITRTNTLTSHRPDQKHGFSCFGFVYSPPPQGMGWILLARHLWNEKSRPRVSVVEKGGILPSDTLHNSSGGMLTQGSSRRQNSLHLLVSARPPE